MRVLFTRTGDRRYGILVQPSGFDDLEMNPAPGFDERLPHDLVHFAVEEGLGIALGVFGQLAAGGDAGTFHLAPSRDKPRERSRKQRRIKRRGARLARAGRRDAEFSERAAAVFHRVWLTRARAPNRSLALGASPHLESLLADSSEAESSMLSMDRIERILASLDLLSEQWSQVEVGGALALEWGRESSLPPTDSA